jgi:hypothetical protein
LAAASASVNPEASAGSPRRRVIVSRTVIIVRTAGGWKESSGGGADPPGWRADPESPHLDARHRPATARHKTGHEPDAHWESCTSLASCRHLRPRSKSRPRTVFGLHTAPGGISWLPCVGRAAGPGDAGVGVPLTARQTAHPAQDAFCCQRIMTPWPGAGGNWAADRETRRAGFRLPRNVAEQTAGDPSLLVRCWHRVGSVRYR